MKHLKWTAVLVLLLAFTACQKSKTANLKDGIYANIKTNKGDILLQLAYKHAPITVANFVSLADGTNTNVTLPSLKGKPFYNGIRFHRVIKKFMIQGGDPLTLDSIPQNDGTGGPGYVFQDEFPKDSMGKLLDTFNRSGVLAMANAGPNTNGSQFFITHVPTEHLNGRHTIFGYVVDGQSVVDSIAQNDTILKVDIIRKGTAAKAFDANGIFTKALKDFKEQQKIAAKKAMEVTIKERQDFINEMKKAGHKVKTYENGLVIATVKATRGVQPKTGEIVEVNYAGRLTNGHEFDSSYKRKAPIKFPVGTGRVIPGWDFGIMQLHKGTKATFFIPSYLAYGARGAGGVIPPNANLIFDVELMSVSKK